MNPVIAFVVITSGMAIGTALGIWFYKAMESLMFSIRAERDR